MNIVDPILFQGRYQPSTPALLLPGGSHEVVTYDQLGQLIHNVGRNAYENGLSRGNVVALIVKDPLLHIVLILGLAKYGIVTVTPNEAVLPASLRVDAIIADVAVSDVGGRRAIFVDESWIAGSGIPIDLGEVDDEDTSYCRFVLTSGTTGESKAAAFAHGRMAFRAMRHQTVFGHRYAECSRIMLDTGWSTAMAFTTLIYVLSRGGMLALRGRSIPETLQALINYRVQALVGSPGSLANLVDLQDKTPHSVPQLEAIVSIGSNLTPALAERVRSRLGTNLISAYGSTEAGVVASAPSTVLAKIAGAVGYITPDVEVDIVDGAGNKLGPGKEGKIRIRSGASPEGLLDRSQTLIPFDPEGYYPGDLGSFTSDGMLIVVGRETAIINLGGDKVSPEKIEMAIAGFPPVRDAGVFSLQSPLGIEQIMSAIVWHDNVDREASRQELRRHLELKLPIVQIPKLFVELDAIPRGQMGKIDRAVLKRVAGEILIRTQTQSAQKR